MEQAAEVLRLNLEGISKASPSKPKDGSSRSQGDNSVRSWLNGDGHAVRVPCIHYHNPFNPSLNPPLPPPALVHHRRPEEETQI